MAPSQARMEILKKGLITALIHLSNYHQFPAYFSDLMKIWHKKICFGGILVFNRYCGTYTKCHVDVDTKFQQELTKQDYSNLLNTVLKLRRLYYLKKDCPVQNCNHISLNCPIRKDYGLALSAGWDKITILITFMEIIKNYLGKQHTSANQDHLTATPVSASIRAIFKRIAFKIKKRKKLHSSTKYMCTKDCK